MQFDIGRIVFSNHEFLRREIIFSIRVYTYAKSHRASCDTKTKTARVNRDTFDPSSCTRFFYRLIHTRAASGQGTINRLPVFFLSTIYCQLVDRRRGRVTRGNAVGN